MRYATAVFFIFRDNNKNPKKKTFINFKKVFFIQNFFYVMLVYSINLVLKNLKKRFTNTSNRLCKVYLKYFLFIETQIRAKYVFYFFKYCRVYL